MKKVNDKIGWLFKRKFFECQLYQFVYLKIKNIYEIFIIVRDSKIL